MKKLVGFGNSIFHSPPPPGADGFAAGAGRAAASQSPSPRGSPQRKPLPPMPPKMLDDLDEAEERIIAQQVRRGKFPML